MGRGGIEDRAQGANPVDIASAYGDGVDFARETAREGLWRYLTDIKSDSSSSGK